MNKRMILLIKLGSSENNNESIWVNLTYLFNLNLFWYKIYDLLYERYQYVTESIIYVTDNLSKLLTSCLLFLYTDFV
jgi:hypothetical protein